MTRNKLRIVELEPARTPFEVMVQWSAELMAKPTSADLADLADRLRDALAFEEDGALAGRRVVEAIDRQADRTCDWGAKSRLRFVGAHVETVLREMGLL